MILHTVIDEIHRLVAPEQQREVCRLLAGVRDAWGDSTWIRLAVLNLARGRIKLMPQWIRLAEADMPDLMMDTQALLDPMWDARFRRPAGVAAGQPR